jgi:hypothetical protein
MEDNATISLKEIGWRIVEIALNWLNIDSHELLRFLSNIFL